MTAKRWNVLIFAVIAAVGTLGCSVASKTKTTSKTKTASSSPTEIRGVSSSGRALASTLLTDRRDSTSTITQDLTSLASEVQQVGFQNETSGPPSGAVPFSLRGANADDWVAPEPWDLTIDQAIQIALANSTVLRSLGAQVIQSPGATPTIYTPAITSTDGVTGIEAALSAFDAQLRSDLFYEDNDRVLNNEFVGGGVNFFKQYLTTLESSISKQSAVGTQFTLRHDIEGDLNNSERNLIVDRAWTYNLESEIRQPLLQGRGSYFNRVAGPNATPGVYNGVVIARLNADISVADLQIALRDYLSDVENAYWDLHFAYMDLAVKTKARDRSLNTYQLLKARADLPGAEKDKLAQAKEQYFRFEQEVQNALAGQLTIGTRGFNGSGGGTFQGSGGVYVNERRLRLIMGLPINDGRLIRTASDPSSAQITFDWNDVISNAISRRTELHSQQLTVEKSEHELAASRNFLLPRLDAVGRYRYRGIGERLYDPVVTISGSQEESDTHEWLVGMSYTQSVGRRQAYAAIRNAQLRVSRERALLEELTRQVTHSTSNALAECDRAYEVMRVAINRERAAQDQYDILNGEAKKELRRQFDFNALLDSERRFAEAETAANRARIQYALALKNLNFEMGALLEYFNIHLTENSSHVGK
ncbi:MAG: TolC family protein [Planctomycetota bacterium]